MLKGSLKVLIFLFLLVVSGTAQEPDDTDVQSFNDVQLNAPMSKHFEFQTAIGLRFGQDLTLRTDGRFTIGAVWRPNRSFNIGPFYSNIYARNRPGPYRQENRFSVRAIFRREFGRHTFQHRSLYENRRRLPRNSNWYRAMFFYEVRLLKTSRLVVSNESFYSSASGRFQRNRFAVGIARDFGQHLSSEFSFMRQNDGLSRPGDLNVIWVTWRIRP